MTLDGQVRYGKEASETPLSGPEPGGVLFSVMRKGGRLENRATGAGRTPGLGTRTRCPFET